VTTIVTRVLATIVAPFVATIVSTLARSTPGRSPPVARWLIRLAGLAALATTAGCIRAPEVIIVDRRTALEEQAMGKHPKLEDELLQAGLAARPAALTRAQLQAAGWRPSRETDAIAALFADALADDERVDELLVRRCVGESSDGTLLDTPSTCSGAIVASDAARLIERVNRNRRQVWAYMSKVKRRSQAASQKAWTRQHHIEVVCGGQVQVDGKWSIKKCAD